MVVVTPAILGSVLNITLVKVDRRLSENSDLKNMLKALRYIEAAIKDYQISDQRSNLLGKWIDDLRALAHEIEDCTDRCMSQLLPMDTEAGRFRRAAYYLANTAKMHQPSGFASKFGKLNKKSADLWTRLQQFKDAPRPTRGPAQQSSPAAADLFACMKDAEDKLVALVEIPLRTMKLKVITIVGFGGQGTTSLARQFYDSTDRRSTQEARRFIHRIWVYAAGMNTPQVHDKIISQLPASRTNNNHESTREERLRACLKGRYLIVIEDVDTIELSSIISGFQWDDGKGSRIIVTKNFESEGRLCGCGSPLVVDINTAQFLKIGELRESGIEEDCNGFEEESRKVLGSNYQNIRSYFPDEFKAYESDALPGYVPPELLLYFCMFPRNHPVRRDLLIKRWLAEGIISTSVQCAASDICRSSQDVAFDALIKSNVIQPIQISKNGRVKRCHSPAMMLDHISSLPELKKFITLCCRPGGNCSDRICRLSLHGSAELPKDLSRLRTMAVFYTGINSIASFSKYELLRVLDLKECGHLKNEHVKKICNLVLLKYLSLGDTIDKVTKKIAKLRQLETLDLSRTRVVAVPAKVIKLPSLTHLLGKFHLLIKRKKEKKYMKFLSKNSKLERLSGFVSTHDGKGFVQMMPHMVSLKKVKVWCDKNLTAHTASLDNLIECIKKFIGEGSNLHGDRRMSIDLQGCSTQCSGLLMESLEKAKYGRLTSLKLRGKLTKFPEFSKLNIIELCLSYTTVSWGNIVASLNGVHALTSLKLVEEHLGPITIQPKQLENLRRMCLVGVRSLRGINISKGALEYLRSLHILCRNTELYPGIDIARHPNLEEVALHRDVDQGTKDLWQEYAARHTKRPKVLFIESGPDPPTAGPESAGTLSQDEIVFDRNQIDRHHDRVPLLPDKTERS